MNIDKEIDKKLNLIVDRYLNLNVPFKYIKKYLTGKNIQLIIDEIYELEFLYLKNNKNKKSRDFKFIIKNKISKIIKDREFAYLDKK